MQHQCECRLLTAGRALSRWVIALAMLTSSCAAGCAMLQGNASGVVILLDYSATFAPYGAADAALLREIQGAITAMVSERALPQPTKIVWAAFGNVGLSPQSPCGPPRIFRQSITGRRGDSDNQINDLKELKASFETCAKAIVATSTNTHQFTDVTGALSFAGSAVEDARQVKLIVVFSDLREDLPAGRSATELGLQGSRVLLVWRPGKDDADNPNAVANRAQEWRVRILKAGANVVCARPSAGLTAPDIARCLN